MSRPRRPTGPTRRDALKGLGAASVLPVAACGGSSPDGSADPGPDTRTVEDLVREKVDTVVFLMFENRSFDHHFGARKLVEGDEEIDGLTADMSNPDPDGNAVPVQPSQTDCLTDPPHAWNASHAQFNEGANDGFVTEYYGRNPAGAGEVMGYWDREMLPISWTLADHSAVCDQWFCSVMGGTWPNRFYALAGECGGITSNDLPTVTFPSVFTAARDAGASIKAYFTLAPFSMLLSDTSLYDPEFGTIEHFFEDAEAGTLPQIVLIDPAFGYNSDHPPEHPMAAQALLASVYEALARSPQWDRVALIVTYDEHGGFFDHVPPPTAPDERKSEGFDQLGFRVPAMVVGPWARPGAVCHEQFEHTSFLALLQRLFGLASLTKRDAAATPPLACFDEQAMREDAPHAPITLPVITMDPTLWERPECGDGGIFLGPIPRDLGMPELAAWLDANAAGTWIDRRGQAGEIIAWLNAKAVELGVLATTGVPR